MTDNGSHNRTPELPDDDRLLAYVLGLSTDPELEAAAANDEVLRRRLDLLRDQVATVGIQVGRAVPPPDADYGEIDGERWTRLRQFVDDDPPAERRRAPRGTVRWLRVLAPAAAIVLLAVVGVAALQRQADVIDQSGKAAEVATSTPTDHMTRSSLRLPDQPSATEHATVVIARAGDVADGLQEFVVLRVLKGPTPATLRLRPATEPAHAGRLLVLYLDLPDSPSYEDAASSEAVPNSSPAASGIPSANPETQDESTLSPDTVVSGEELRFVDEGRAVVALTLPEVV